MPWSCPLVAHHKRHSARFVFGRDNAANGDNSSRAPRAGCDNGHVVAMVNINEVLNLCRDTRLEWLMSGNKSSPRQLVEQVRASAVHRWDESAEIHLRAVIEQVGSAQFLRSDEILPSRSAISVERYFALMASRSRSARNFGLRDADEGQARSWMLLPCNRPRVFGHDVMHARTGRHHAGPSLRCVTMREMVRPWRWKAAR